MMSIIYPTQRVLLLVILILGVLGVVGIALPELDSVIVCGAAAFVVAVLPRKADR